MHLFQVARKIKTTRLNIIVNVFTYFALTYNNILDKLVPI